MQTWEQVAQSGIKINWKKKSDWNFIIMGFWSAIKFGEPCGPEAFDYNEYLLMQNETSYKSRLVTNRNTRRSLWHDQLNRI